MKNPYIKEEHVAAAKALLAKMTTEEKVGQLATKDYYNEEKDKPAICSGKLGNIFFIGGIEQVNMLQRMAVEETRLGIPMLFGYDVIHGNRTVFPIPLGSAASWDTERIEKAERYAAMESWAQGINWIYAPMVDLCREPRWGRIAEGAGEDPYLGSCVAAARVRGFQTINPKTGYPYTAACFKHYCGYGLSEGGRDYDAAEISERLLYGYYMKPYRAAVDAGALSVMSSFNSLNGEPVSGSYHYLTEVLRHQMGFEGFCVSDYEAIKELINHGVAADEKDAVRIGITAGNDMDMTDNIYGQYLVQMAENDPAIMEKVDESTLRILTVKYALGLFEHPYRTEEEAEGIVLSAEAREAARDVAKHSMVLLKNEEHLLPLQSGKKYLVTGPLANLAHDMMGMWNTCGHDEDVVTPLAALQERTDITVTYTPGCQFDSDSEEGFAEGVRLAQDADTVLCFGGEACGWSGENCNRANPVMPAVQMRYLEELKKTGKKVVFMLMTGRPLACADLDRTADAILCTWHAGVEAGHAIGDVLFGDFSPCGKLPVTFPRAVGQIPMYYWRLSSGRPQYLCYQDQEKTPLYPFGYGLSYADITYSDRTVLTPEVGKDGTVKASVTLTNRSGFDAHQVVQCYFRDMVSTYATPVRKLCDFRKVLVPAGGSVTVTFEIPVSRFAYMTPKLEEIVEPGEFRLFMGESSAEQEGVSFRVVD